MQSNENPARRREYEDFKIEVGLCRDSGYAVVCNRPAGEERGTMRLPFDAATFRGELLRVENALLRSGTRRRGSLSSQEKTVEDFGRALFEALLNGELRIL